MMTEETRKKLREMNLSAFADGIDMQSQENAYLSESFDERFQRLVDYAYQEKHNEKVFRLLNAANFKFRNAEVNSIHYTERGIDRQLILELSTCQFIERNIHLVFQGFTGTGKTYLACAMGKQACKRGQRVRYIRMPDLSVQRDEATIQAGGVGKLLKKYASHDLIILDEWLLDKPNAEERRFLFELLERRLGHGSIIFCTQYKKEDWHARLGGGVHADAIMDRVVHNAIWVETGTMNMREHYAKIQLLESRES